MPRGTRPRAMAALPPTLPQSSRAAKLAPAQRWLFVYDFDWSLINENSDTYVVEALGGAAAREHMRALGRDMPWTQKMDHMCAHVTRDVAARGGDPAAAVARAMAGVPVFPEQLDVIRTLGARANWTQVIVSDANTLFIDTFLQHHKLSDCFAEVVTNPSRWEEEENERREGSVAAPVEMGAVAVTSAATAGGESKDVAPPGQRRVLRVDPFVNPSRPHGCATCARSPNMCKGLIMDAMLRKYGGADDPSSDGDAYFSDEDTTQTRAASGMLRCGSPDHTGQSTWIHPETGTRLVRPRRGVDGTALSHGGRLRVVYLGDGSGDYCGCLRLGPQDLILCREGYSLEKKLQVLRSTASQEVLAALPECVSWSDGKSMRAALRTRGLLPATGIE